MTFERKHDDLTVKIAENRSADLLQGDDWIALTPHQLYALVDDVATADPEEWARRFDPRDAIERHLRQVADYFRARAQVNREAAAQSSDAGRVYFGTMADTFDVAVTTVMEEIELLYEDDPKVTFCNWCGGGRPKEEFHPGGSVAHVLPRGPALKAVNDNLSRRRA